MIVSFRDPDTQTLAAGRRVKRFVAFESVARRKLRQLEIAGRLDKLLYAFEGTDLRGLFLRHEGELRKLHKGIEERIADSRLADADKLLYKLEDIFELIEADLS